VKKTSPSSDAIKKTVEAAKHNKAVAIGVGQPYERCPQVHIHDCRIIEIGHERGVLNQSTSVAVQFVKSEKKIYGCEMRFVDSWRHGDRSDCKCFGTGDVLIREGRLWQLLLAVRRQRKRSCIRLLGYAGTDRLSNHVFPAARPLDDPDSFYCRRA
jgi:hypothetical protein